MLVQKVKAYSGASRFCMEVMLLFSRIVLVCISWAVIHCFNHTVLSPNFVQFFFGDQDIVHCCNCRKPPVPKTKRIMLPSSSSVIECEICCLSFPKAVSLYQYRYR
jgi:hypothetical protein